MYIELAEKIVFFHKHMHVYTYTVCTYLREQFAIAHILLVISGELVCLFVSTLSPLYKALMTIQANAVKQFLKS